VLLRPGRAWLCTQGPDRVRRHASLIPTRATTASGGCGGSQELGTLCVAVAETICPVICHGGHTSSPHSSAAWSKPVTSWAETSRSNCAQLAVDTIDSQSWLQTSLNSNVALIATGITLAALAAKAATTTIPIVFATSEQQAGAR
jgi:hypothetical protein